MSREWTRRDFLRAAGIGAAGGALLPFFPTPAQAGAGIQRLVLFSHGNGTILDNWRSNGSGAALANGAALPELEGPILAPLERHRSAVTLVDGLDNWSGHFAIREDGGAERNEPGHNGNASLWSGARIFHPRDIEGMHPTRFSLTPTIDQILAENAETRVPCLVVGTSPTGRGTYAPSLGTTSYLSDRVRVPPEPDPRVVFDLLFAGVVDGDSIAVRRRRASRRGILSRVRGELTRLRGELPSADRERLDRHLEGVDAIDRRFAADGGGSTCTAMTRPGETSETSPSELLIRLNLQLDIVTRAFACDLTRIANVLFGCDGTNRFWLPPSALPIDPRNGDMHGISHETMDAPSEADRQIAVEIVTRLQRQVAEEFAGLLDRLETESMLADTLAVWGTGMGWGGAHVNYNIPFVLASGHASFAGGRYHRYGDYELRLATERPRNPWQAPSTIHPHNRMLTSILHLMGRTDLTAVGDSPTPAQTGGIALDASPIAELFS